MISSRFRELTRRGRTRTLPWRSSSSFPIVSPSFGSQSTAIESRLRSSTLRDTQSSIQSCYTVESNQHSNERIRSMAGERYLPDSNTAFDTMDRIRNVVPHFHFRRIAMGTSIEFESKSTYSMVNQPPAGYVVESLLPPLPRRRDGFGPMLPLASSKFSLSTASAPHFYAPLKTPKSLLFVRSSPIQVRCFTTSKNDNKPENDPEKSSNNPPQHHDSKHGMPHIQEIVDTTMESVRPIVHSAEVNLKKAADVVRLQDLGTLYGIVLLVFLIITTPYVARRMRGSDGNEPDVNPEDPVMDLAKIFRTEFLVLGEGEEGNSATAMGLDRIVADLLRSPQVQEAVSDLVANVLQSPQFKRACQILLKELLQDLLNDPDTLKQVIHLLQNAIADEKIKEASIQLVTDVFGDDRVLDELVTLVQRLGMEQQVQMATQALLVESAHNALNDPEILDHSMEFATDVVGDDVVQQTAGEALYNTLSYAIRPTLSVLLTFLGIGLIALSLSAFRSANDASGESVDQAFLRTIEESATRFFKFISLPYDLAMALKEALTNVLLFPFRLLSKGFNKTTEVAQTLVDYIQTWFLWLFNLPGDFFATISARLGDISRYIGSLLLDKVDSVKSASAKSSVGIFFHESTKHASVFLYRTRIRWARVNKSLSGIAVAVEEFGMYYIDAIQRAIDTGLPKWRNGWAMASETASDGWAATRSRTANAKDWVSRDYYTANRVLARWALAIEATIEKLSSSIRSLKNR